MLADLVTEELQWMLGKSVYEGYRITEIIKGAHEIFDKFLIGQETLPWVRRVAVDFSAMRNSRSVSGLIPEIRPNRGGNYHHLELRYRERLIITISHVSDGEAMPGGAHFRTDLSKHNPQTELFPSYQEKSLGDGLIYAILTHEGKDIPSGIALKVKHPDFNRSVTELPIVFDRKNADPDVNIIGDVTTEFIKFIKKTSNSGDNTTNSK